MKTMQSSRIYPMRFTILLLLFSLFSSFATASNSTYQESASEVMLTTFESGQSDRMLKELYTQLYFVPVWTTDDATSSLTKALFDKIANDRTLESSSSLKQDSLSLEKEAEVLYSGHATLKEKVDLEAKQLKEKEEVLLCLSKARGFMSKSKYDEALSLVAAAFKINPFDEEISKLQQEIFTAQQKEKIGGRSQLPPIFSFC